MKLGSKSYFIFMILRPPRTRRTDTLLRSTTLFRTLEAVVNRELRRVRREVMPIALLAVDIDWFKAYNDTFGHPQGDQCLRRVAGTLRACLRRAGDAAARPGGEAFVLNLPNRSEERRGGQEVVMTGETRGSQVP